MSLYQEYGFRCSDEGSGEIYKRPDEKPLYFTETRQRVPHNFYGMLWLPDFKVYDRAGRKLFVFSRVGRLPLNRFAVLEKGARIGTIRQRSPLLNRYALEFDSGPNWTFRMPLYTVDFWGKSETGAEVRARLLSHNAWHVRIDAGADDLRLVASLALIHRERVRFA